MAMATKAPPIPEALTPFSKMEKAEPKTGAVGIRNAVRRLAELQDALVSPPGSKINGLCAGLWWMLSRD